MVLAVDRSLADTPEVITNPYLLALDIRLIRSSSGEYYADPSWAKDLARHVPYLPRLIYAAPVIDREPTEHEVRISEGLRIVPLPAYRNFVCFLRALPTLLATLWKEVARADVIHTGLVGHPVPIGWLAAPMARLRSKRLLIVIESAFWRTTGGSNPGFLRRVRAAVFERVNRLIMRHTDHAFYTHDTYQRQFPATRALTSATIAASWIDDDMIVTTDELEARWDRHRADRRLKVLFAARLVAEKGTTVVVDAVRLLAAANIDVAIDIIGAGPELQFMEASMSDPWSREHVRFLAPVPYGAQFLSVLDGHDAIIVPSISDEQPRVVYDAYARGTAVIASDVPGLRACVEDGTTGRLVPPGNARALADVLISIVRERDPMRRWAREGRHRAQVVTHDQMHRDRAAILKPFYS